MATTGWRKNTSVVDQLQQQPQRFDFFQAVRLLELTAHWYAKHGKGFARVPAAAGAPPNREAVRFRGRAGVSFSGAHIERISIENTVEQQDQSEPKQQWQMAINIFGLFGSSGVLPFHISELIIQRLREKDRSLQDFLDVLNHRSSALYFQAWHKYRLPVAFERAKLSGSERDLFSHGLAALVGLGTPATENKLSVPDQALMGFSGLLSGHTPSATSLARMLEHYFELPVSIQQFVGQWQELPADIQSRLPGQGQNNSLGRNVLLGRQCWEVQSKFRIKIEDIDYHQFVSIEPNSKKMAALKAFVRFVVGSEYDFDIEISICPSQLPSIGIGQVAVIAGQPVAGGGLMLGWSSHLPTSKGSKASEQMQQAFKIRVTS